jgi:hypothetical protein
LIATGPGGNQSTTNNPGPGQINQSRASGTALNGARERIGVEPHDSRGVAALAVSGIALLGVALAAPAAPT